MVGSYVLLYAVMSLVTESYFMLYYGWEWVMRSPGFKSWFLVHV